MGPDRGECQAAPPDSAWDSSHYDAHSNSGHDFG
jgi:hypothetical protein